MMDVPRGLNVCNPTTANVVVVLVHRRSTRIVEVANSLEKWATLQLLWHSSFAKTIHCILHLLIWPLLLLKIWKEYVQCRFEKSHQSLLVLKYFADTKRDEFSLWLVNMSEFNRMAEHDCRLAINEVNWVWETLLVKIQIVYSSQAFQILVNQALLVNCQLCSVPPVEVHENGRNDVHVELTFWEVFDTGLPCTIANEHLIKQLETITVLRKTQNLPKQFQKLCKEMSKDHLIWSELQLPL